MADRATADPLSPLREQAMQRFLELGLPTSRDETWRYTNLRSLAAQSFVDAPRSHRRRRRAATRRCRCWANRSAPHRCSWSTAIRGCPPRRACDRGHGNPQPAGNGARSIPRRCCAFWSPCPTPTSSAGSCSIPRCSSTACISRSPAACATPLVILHVAAGDGADTHRLSARHHRGGAGLERHHHRAPRGAGRTRAAEQFQHADCARPRRAARALPRVRDRRRRHAHRFARYPPGPRTAAASSSPSRWAAAWCAPRSRRDLGAARRLARQLFAAGGTRGPARRLRQHRDPWRARHAQPRKRRAPSPATPAASSSTAR